MLAAPGDNMPVSQSLSFPKAQYDVGDISYGSLACFSWQQRNLPVSGGEMCLERVFLIRLQESREQTSNIIG